MIIGLNGAFDVDKTQTVFKLHSRILGSLVSETNPMCAILKET